MIEYLFLTAIGADCGGEGKEEPVRYVKNGCPMREEVIVGKNWRLIFKE